MADLGKQILNCVQSLQKFQVWAPSYYNKLVKGVTDMKYVKNIVDTIKRIIKNKKAESHQKYFALRLLFVCMAAKNPDFGKYVVEKIISRLLVLACFKSESKSQNRGQLIFGGNCNKEYGKQFLKVLLASFTIWKYYYENIPQYSKAITTLLKQGVAMPGIAKLTKLKKTQKFLLQNIIPEDAQIFKEPLGDSSHESRGSLQREMISRKPPAHKNDGGMEELKQPIRKKPSINIKNEIEKIKQRLRIVQELKQKHERVVNEALMSGDQTKINSALQLGDMIDAQIDSRKVIYETAKEMFQSNKKMEQEEKKEAKPRARHDSLKMNNSLSNNKKLESIPEQTKQQIQMESRRSQLKNTDEQKQQQLQSSKQKPEQQKKKKNIEKALVPSVNIFQSTTIPSTNVNKSNNDFDFFASTSQPTSNFDPFSFDFSGNQQEKKIQDKKEVIKEPPKLEQSSNAFDFQSQFATHSGNQNDFFSQPQSSSTQKDDGFGWNFGQNETKGGATATTDDWGFGSQTPNTFEFNDAQQNKKDDTFDFNAKQEPPAKSALNFNSTTDYAKQDVQEVQQQFKEQPQDIDQQCPGVEDDERIEPSSHFNSVSHSSKNSVHATLQTKTLQAKQQEFRTNTTLQQQESQRNKEDQKDWRSKLFQQQEQPQPNVFNFQQYASSSNAMQTFGIKKEKLPTFNQPKQQQYSSNKEVVDNYDDAFSFQPNQSQQQQKQQQSIEIVEQQDAITTQRKDNFESPATVGKQDNFWFGSNEFERATDVEGFNEQPFGRLSKDDWNLSSKKSTIVARRQNDLKNQIKQLEIKNSQLENKLSEKQLNKQKDLKYCEQRILQLEKTISNLQMLIKQKDDRIGHHKSQIFQLESRFRDERTKNNHLQNQRQKLQLQFQQVDYQLTYQKNLKDKLSGQMRDMKLMYESRIQKLNKELSQAKKVEAPNASSSSMSATPGYFLKQALSPPNKRQIYARGVNNSSRLSDRRSNEEQQLQSSQGFKQQSEHQSQKKKKFNPASPQSVAPQSISSSSSSITPKIFESDQKPVANYSSPLKQSDLQDTLNSIQITSVHTVDMSSGRMQRSSMKHIKRQSTQGSNVYRTSSNKIGKFQLDEMDDQCNKVLPIQTPTNKAQVIKGKFQINPISNLDVNLSQDEKSQAKNDEDEQKKANENQIQKQEQSKKNLQEAARLMSNSQFDSSTSSFQFLKSRSNSKQSYFSICSDIGSVSGSNLNIFKPPGLVSLDEKSAMFYKSGIFLDKGVLFEDYRTQIGFLKIKVPQALCYNFQIFIGNKNGSYPMSNFEFVRKEQPLPQTVSRQSVQGYDIQIDKYANQIAIRKQQKIGIKFSIQQGKTFIAGPLYQIKFEQGFYIKLFDSVRINNQKVNIPIRLPMLQVHFVQAIQDFPTQYGNENKFEEAYKSMNNQLKLNFTPDFNRLKSLTKIEALLKHKNHFSVLRPTINPEYVKGGIYFACQFGNSLFFRQSVMGKIKIRPNLNQSEISINSNSSSLTRAVLMGILELLCLSGPNIPNF